MTHGRLRHVAVVVIAVATPPASECFARDGGGCALSGFQRAGLDRLPPDPRKVVELSFGQDLAADALGERADWDRTVRRGVDPRRWWAEFLPELVFSDV